MAELDDLAGGAVVNGPRIIAKRIVVHTELDPYLTLKALAVYSGIGVCKLRGYLDDPVHPLPHFRVGRKILVRRLEFDAWITTLRQVGTTNADRLVAEVLADLN